MTKEEVSQCVDNPQIDAAPQSSPGPESAPEDVFAAMFYMNLPRFKEVLHDKRMSSRMLRRLILALIEVPINMKEYNPTTEFEKNAFLLGNRLLESKMFMIMTTLYQEMEKPENQMEENTNGEIKGKMDESRSGHEGSQE